MPINDVRGSHSKADPAPHAGSQAPGHARPVDREGAPDHDREGRTPTGDGPARVADGALTTGRVIEARRAIQARRYDDPGVIASVARRMVELGHI